MQSTPRTSHASAKALIAACGVALLAAASPAMAKQSDRQQVVDVKAKSFDGSQQPQGIAIYTTGVVITQGTLKVTGVKATIYFDDQNQVTRAVIVGSPATIEQQDDDGNWMHGHAANVDYHNDTGIAILTGNAHIDQPTKGTADGDKLTYNTNDSTMTGESNGASTVHMTFQPKTQPGAAPAKPAAPATPAAPAPNTKKP
ncbi:lipopolysaccharide transport periplasmic protein LptA [Luteibacter pinisoli]|jgi:lipopolysaccharide export system protein LptA|uniref:Lipopolysaccharide transport periplasmic protein LptA n=1 Tax=Luteibacter pinisoli TaxID=2589080 RepID=A0A4Y5Z1K6_9GAMM|nr:lipopolysaccharide transport periplasmic protein LptA [Luteibacter pinisoli]QDE38535.1 lipopolysaccharide transport periplasmic protein LptA [Luteibacter pinisoli]